MRGMWSPSRRQTTCTRYDCIADHDKYRYCRQYRNQWFPIMDRLTSMSVFVKAAETGSFAAAAAQLRLSSPMVGKHVRFLEERLGARLLNRTTRPQSLTEIRR